MPAFTLVVLLASAAFGQNLSRTFQLQNTNGVGMQEMATTLHSVFDIRDLSIDNSVSTLTVSGNAGQIALAEWLIPKLDVPLGTSPTSQKYLYAGNNNDVVEIYEIKNAPAVTDLQEMLTSLRTVVEIQRIYQSTAPRLLIIRADANHIAAADFLISQIDQPVTTRTAPALQSFQMPGSTDSVIVYGLAHTGTTRDLQEMLTNLRTVLNIQWIYQRTPQRILSMRGNADQIRMAEWLIPQLDKETATGSGAEMRAPNGKDDVLHVFYLAAGTDANDALKSVRQMKVPMAYVRTNLPALTVRGTADQIAMVGSSLPLLK